MVLVGTRLIQTSEVHVCIGPFIASQPGSHWFTVSRAVKDLPLMLPNVLPAALRIALNVPWLSAATVDPYMRAGFRPVANTCLPSLLPNLVTRARLAAFAVHRDLAPFGALVRAPGPYSIPRCFAFWVIKMPSRRIVVDILPLTLGHDTATVDFAFPAIAQRSLRETFMCRSSSRIWTSMSVAAASTVATMTWSPTTCKAMSSTYKHTVKYNG